MRIVAAEAAVSFAVETLGKLLIEKAEFLVGVEEDVEWLKKELRSMQCFLKDAAKKQSDSESIRNLLSDIREVAHDAEDAIEMFVLKVQSKSVKKRYGCFPNHLYHLNEVGEQIASIRQTLKDIQDRRVRYDIQKDGDDRREEPSTRMRSQEYIQTRRRLAYWKPDQQVVGLQEDMKLLLRKAVFQKSTGLSVAAILGMGGMGKSTLAGKIYNHTEVVGRFGFRSWVVVSSEFNPEDVMKQILLQLGISVDELKGLGSVNDKVGRQEELKKEVHQRLTGKRYFIVLDDLWEAAHWESLSTALTHGDKGSRLLLTSRNQVITMDDGYMHKMKALNENESWELFMRKALGGNYSSIGGCPEELKKVGKEILKKCGGLPLAISVVGGLLAKKTRSKSEWEKVHTEMKSHLDTRNGDLNTIKAILELSYQNLPLELKACFLCLGFFKEDAVVKAKELVHIWVARGLVPKEVEGEGVRMEDVARDYLNELISRNMVQVKEMEYDIVKCCQMHDLLRDLSIRKAKEEIDFEVVREEGNSSHQSLAKPRHRAIYCSETRFVYSTDQNQHLRSLFVHFEDRCRLHVSGGPSSYWKSFELLRILDLGNTIFKVLPKGIGMLNGLKYLRMSYNGKASRLPRSWAKLKNLEVLHLRGYGEGEGIKIDKVVLKMKSLRHLYLSVDCCKVSLENLWNLQTLHLFRVKNSSDPWKIEGMSGVPILDFDWLWSLTSRHLHPLTRLKLRGILPLHFPPNLSHLNLTQMRLDKDKMHILEKLPNLLHLKLQYVDICVGTLMIKTGGFPSLKVLHIKNIDYVWNLNIEEDAMPELDQFIIRQCPNFDVENLPERIKSAIIVQAH